MISLNEALDRIRSAVRPIGVESVSITAAAGRVLAEPLIADICSPRSDVSAMDGYAVREQDLELPPARLRIVGQSFAGAAWGGAVGDGECTRIFTGAPLPPGTDRVIIQEEVHRDGDIVIMDKPIGNARHIRAQASDFDRGETLLPVGRLLDKRAIVTAAGADVAKVKVFARPRVAILSTGDELAEPGTARATPDAIPESVSFGIAAMVCDLGGVTVSRKRLRDEPGSMAKAAISAIDAADLIIVTGGASVGEKDFAKSMFEPAGLELIFSKVSIKPGKPVWFGRAGSALVMGLPGNPTSALVTARLLLAPLLAGLNGRDIGDVLRWQVAKITARLEVCGARETFHRGRWSAGAIELLDFQDSSAQKALAEADVLVRQYPNSPAIPAGGAVEVLDF